MIQLLNIPMPPTVNKLYGGGLRTKRRFKTELYLNWEDELQNWALINSRTIILAQNLFLTERYNHIIRVDKNFYFTYSSIFSKTGKMKKMDTSNRIKPLEDGLVQVLGIDDCYFKSGMVQTYLIPYLSDKESYCDITMQWELATWAA